MCISGCNNNTWTDHLEHQKPQDKKAGRRNKATIWVTQKMKQNQCGRGKYQKYKKGRMHRYLSTPFRIGKTSRNRSALSPNEFRASKIITSLEFLSTNVINRRNTT